MKQTKQKKLRSPANLFKLEHYVLIFMLIFTVCVVLLLWVFQIKLMPNYFKSVTIRNVKSAIRLIDDNIDTASAEELNKIMDDIASKNGFMIIVTDGYGYLTSDIIDYMGGRSENKYAYFVEFHKTIQSIYASSNGSYYAESMNDYFHMSQLIYGKVITSSKNPEDARIVLVNAFIEPIRSTMSIMREQFFFIALITCELSLLLSLYISKALSKPISRIAKSAKQFANGDYSVTFDEKGFMESSQLAQTLNYAVSEVSKVNELRRDLMANVSHDLKTPLTMIKAYAEMIRDLSGDNPVKREEHLSVIIDETDRLTKLVGEILELSRLESHNTELKKTEFTIHDKLDEVMGRYQLLVDTEGYDIRVEKDEDRIICADSARLDQIIYNLVNNAINYSGDEKRIIIRQTNLGNDVRIDIIDNGIGIAPENLSNIFDRYYRGEKVKRDKMGTGLGLSIVKEIFKSHGFKYGVSSTLGEGSDFWFEIPDTKKVE